MKVTVNKSQKFAVSVGKAIAKQQPKGTLDRIYGILPAEYGGINPIVNTSYPSERGKSNKKKRKS